MTAIELILDYPDHEPATVWQALAPALHRRTVRRIDDITRTARLRTGVSSTSWGGDMQVSTTAGLTRGTRIRLTWQPRIHLRTYGEDLAARTLQAALRNEIDRALQTP